MIDSTEQFYLAIFACVIGFMFLRRHLWYRRQPRFWPGVVRADNKRRGRRRSSVKRRRRR